MLKEKLKLVVSAPQSFAGTDYTKEKDLIEKALKEGHKVMTLAGAYLHGEVESSCGYDICACINAELCVDDTNTHYKEGIYEVEIEGYQNPCKAYLWNTTHGEPRGLIVDSKDSEIEYAKKCFEEKERFL